MNMVGYKGTGVSGWLTVATAYALNLWANVCDERGEQGLTREFRAGASACNAAVVVNLWDGRWFGRGITDDGTVFGVSTDPEGSIFLNVQSWSMLSGAADETKQKLIIESIAEKLETPYGVMTLAPAFTSMREDVGRITQKFPGSAENGSVYNHDSTFYIFALYLIGDPDRAFRILRQLIPGPDPADYERRGQLPIFVPNYYRGAFYQNPRTAGRSSMLFNTGTASWMYRCLVEGLFGVKGCRSGLLIRPQLPSHWDWARIVRTFRGATFEIDIRRDTATHEVVLTVDGRESPDGIVTEIEVSKTYRVVVLVPSITA
jgi:cellobionic acid phosphorylase